MNMIGLAILAAIAAFLVVGFLTGGLATHKAEAGFIPGIVAAIWAASPLLLKGGEQRYNFLHPVPKRYKISVKQAFKKVRDVLDETTYNFGDGWKVSIADTQAKRIKATLKWTDEESKMEAGHGTVNTRTVRVQRLLELDVQMKEEPNDSTVVQFDFHPRIEGLVKNAGDSYVASLLSHMEVVLGGGTDAGNPLATHLPAPPWWLLGLTAWVLFLFMGDVISAVFH